MTARYGISCEQLERLLHQRGMLNGEREMCSGYAGTRILKSQGCFRLTFITSKADIRDDSCNNDLRNRPDCSQMISIPCLPANVSRDSCGW
jgi:hypothetical protein